VLAGLIAFHNATGQAPRTSIGWYAVRQRVGRELGRSPTAYAVLRHFPSFRAAWRAVGVQLPDEHWAPWTAEEDRFLLDRLGMQSTVAIATALGRGEAAVRTRARKLGVHVMDAQGWPLLRIARITGLSEYLLRAYIRRGELRTVKGAKFVYIDPGDLPVIGEINWHQVPADLELAAQRSLRERSLALLASRTVAPVSTPSRLPRF
jgi:hypothetical protein